MLDLTGSFSDLIILLDQFVVNVIYSPRGFKL